MTDLSLIQHYLDYLRSPAVLLTILVITGPFLLEAFKNKKLESQPSAYRITGCFRLGMTKRSNLHNQDKVEKAEKLEADGQRSKTSKPTIKALFTYPVKSCGEVKLAASEVGPTGLKYDRLFTFAVSKRAKQESDNSPGKGEWQWHFITQREYPRLALLHTELWAPDPRTKKETALNGKTAKSGSSPLESDDADVHDWPANGGCVLLRFQYKPEFNPLGLRTEHVTLQLPLIPTSARAKAKKYTSESISIWKDCPTASNVTNEIASHDLKKLKDFLGVKTTLGIFRVDDRSRRRITRSLPQDKSNDHFRVGFADAFPIHILSLPSVRSIFSQQPDQEQRKYLDARRFRANIYLSNTRAFEEDSWKRIHLGRGLQSHPSNNRKMVETDGEYHVACRTARCKLPNVHPETGVKDANEPYSTLARTRKVDEGANPHPVLGMQMIPLFQQGILRVGDKVEVLETGEHVYEKMFA